MGCKSTNNKNKHPFSIINRYCGFQMLLNPTVLQLCGLFTSIDKI